MKFQGSDAVIFASAFKPSRTRSTVLCIVAAVLATLCIGAASADAATRLVANTGSNSGDCTSSACQTLQYATDQAINGDTIEIDPGTYASATTTTVLVNKSDLTYRAANPDNQPVIRPAAVANARAFELVDASDGLTLENLVIESPNANPLTHTLTGIYAANTGSVDINGVSLNGVEVSGLNWGVRSTDTGGSNTILPIQFTDWTITDSDILGNQFGLYFGSRVNGLEITESQIDGNDYGVYSRYLGYSSGPPASGIPARRANTFNDVSITDSTINLSGKKGMYLEAASNFTVDNVAIDGTGSQPAVKPDPDSVPYNGIDINLKYVNDPSAPAFENISITDSTVSGAIPNPLNVGPEQPAIAIKARNDAPSYNTNPTTLETLELDGLVVTGTTENSKGIMVGNAVTDASINNSVITGNPGDGLQSYVDTGAIDAENNWWGCNGGPGAEGCDTAVALTPDSVDSSPYLQLSVSSNPATVGMNGIAAVTATFNRNSDGQTVSAPVLDGVTVGFSATGGSVNPDFDVVSGGNATTTFAAGSTPGPASVTAAIGSVSVTQDFTLDPVAATVSAPSLAGSGQVGEVLTCTPGDVTGGNPTPTVETVLLMDGAAIPGQSGLTYTPVGADVGKSITCRTTATNSAGSPSASSPGVTVTGIAPAVSAPSLAGSGQVGQVLTCTPGNVTGGNPTPTVVTVLLMDGAAIPGQSGLSYTPVGADVGKSITCRTTATNPAGSPSATSPGVTVTGIAPTVSAPSLAGSGQVGQALTCTPGNVTGGNPTPTVVTVLLMGGAAIPGQSGLSYTPVAGDIGKSITCRTTATNPAGSPSATSPGITVRGIQPTVSVPGLAGSGQVGEALTCTPGNATGGTPSPTVETVLLAGGAAIPGQSGLSYTPVDADVGKSITCRTTATNSAGTASQTSPAITVTAVPDPPKPPVVEPVKQNVTVPSSGKVVVTEIKCPEGSCEVQAPKKIKVKIGGKTYTATVKVQKNVPEGESAKVTIVLPKKARKALKGKSGKAKLKITVTSTDGKKKTVNQTIKLKGKKG